MKTALWVALGSGLGAVTRVGVVAALSALLGHQFPFGVLAVNVAGSFAIGLGATLTAPGGRVSVSPGARQFFLAGFCGGFTTFSIFSLQTMQLMEEDRLGAALLYSALTLALAMLAVWLGHSLAIRANRLERSSA